MKYTIDYLGTCPHCGGDNVGYVLYGLDDIHVHDRYRRKNGCHVRFKDPFEYDRNGLNPNRFCYDCDVEWISEEKPEKIQYSQKEYKEYEKVMLERNLHTSQIHIEKPSKIKTKFGKIKDKIKSYSFNPFS